MDENSLRAQLELAVSAEPPLGPMTDNVVRAGRKLRRRRHRAVAASLAVAGVLAVIAPSAYGALTAADQGRGHGGQGPASAAGQAPTTAFVETAAGNIVPVNLATGRPGPQIRTAAKGVGADTGNLAVTPDGRTLYVSSDNGTLVPVDTASAVVGRPISVPTLPRQADTVVITPDGKTALAVEATRGVTPVRLATQTALPQITLRQAWDSPADIAVAPHGSDQAQAYVRTRHALGGTAYLLTSLYRADGRGAGVVVTPVGTASGIAGRPVTIRSRNGGMGGIAVSPDGTTVYAVTATPGGSGQPSFVTPIATATDTALKPITLGKGSGGAMGITIAPDGRTAYVQCATGIIPVDLTAGIALAPIPLQPKAWGYSFAIAPNGRVGYVLSANTAEITPIDLATGTALSPITFGKPNDPMFVAFAPDGTTAYAGLAGENALLPITTATGVPGRPIRLPGAPAEMVFGR